MKDCPLLSTKNLVLRASRKFTNKTTETPDLRVSRTAVGRSVKGNPGYSTKLIKRIVRRPKK